MSATASALLHGTLPISRTRLLGREAERTIARTFLLEEAVPLLTLTGPGGVGKTRLAVAIAGDVAGHFADGVAFVDLAPLTDPGLVATTAAAALFPTSVTASSLFPSAPLIRRRPAGSGGLRVGVGLPFRCDLVVAPEAVFRFQPQDLAGAPVEAALGGA